jgi:hypothetical protein
MVVIVLGDDHGQGGDRQSMNGPHPLMRPLVTRQDCLIPLPKTIPNHCNS